MDRIVKTEFVKYKEKHVGYPIEDREKTIFDFSDDYYAIRGKIRNLLSEKNNWGKECTCKSSLVDMHIINIIEFGIFENPVITYCLDCGGYVGEHEREAI